MTDRIISLDLFRKARSPRPAEALSERGTAILCGLEAYWRSLPCEGGIPKRRAIEARTLGDALPHAFIAERIAPGICRVRVAGRKISELVGTEARGLPLSALFSLSAREALQTHIEKALNGPAVVALPITAPKGLRRAALNGQLLLMPLRSEDGRVDRLLGALVVEGEYGSAPRRVDIAPSPAPRCDRVFNNSNLQRLFSTRHENSQISNKQASNTQMQDTEAQNIAPLRPVSEGRHLRLLVDNDRS